MRSGFVGSIGLSPYPRATVPPRAVIEDAGSECVLLDAPWGWVAARLRAAERFDVARHPFGTTIAILGLLVDASGVAPVLTSAEDLAALLGPDGAGTFDPARFEGSYQVLVIDERRRRVRLINDHLASRPLFHSHDVTPFCFGRSETEVAANLGRTPRVSLDGAAGFLANGYPLGPYTLVEGVRRLRPARDVRIEADGGMRERQWWDLTFGGEAPTRLGDAVEEVRSLARASIAATLADGVPFQLALTGGYDSRLLLALLREAGRLPEATFTWMHRPGVAGSDPDVAHALAERCGVPHHALRYDPASFATHVETWTKTSALGSDNLGHFCAGEHFLSDHGLPARPVLLGDHVLGLGGAFATNDEAIASVLRTPWPDLSPTIQALLTPEAVQRLRETVGAQIAAIAEPCNACSPKDLHHYLYFHVGVFGWLLAPGYYKEPVVEARRPLASRALLTAAARWPASLRHDKRVVVALLRDQFPDLHAVPTADRSALVDWPTAVRDVTRLRDVLEGMLQSAIRDGSVLAGDLQHDTLTARLVALCRSTSTSTTGRRRMRALAVRARRALGHIGSIAGPLHRVGRLLRHTVAHEGAADDDVRQLFRIGLLAAFERQLALEPSGPIDGNAEVENLP